MGDGELGTAGIFWIFRVAAFIALASETRSAFFGVGAVLVASKI